jgi:nitrate reductase NapE
MYLFLTVVLWPAFAVAFVGSWGLAVWLYQAMTGHPSL